MTVVTATLAGGKYSNRGKNAAWQGCEACHGPGISPNAPSGALDSKFLQPYLGFDYGFSRNWTGKAYWGYHGYHEDADAGAAQDVLAPKSFHTNLVTLSLRYAF